MLARVELRLCRHSAKPSTHTEGRDMKMIEAMRIIQSPQGYMVHFQQVVGNRLRSDWFPDKHAGEPLIETEDEAWRLAKAFSCRTFGTAVDIYVIGADFVPVYGYKSRAIPNR